MRSSSEKKYGSLSVENGGLYGRPLTAAERFEREFRSWAARGKAHGGRRYACRALADTAQGLRFPNRIPARIAREALAGGATPEWAEGFAPIWQRFVRDLAAEMGKSTPEPLPPAPAMPMKQAA